MTIAARSTAAVMTMMLRRTLGVEQQVRLQEALVQSVEQVARVLARGIQNRVNGTPRGQMRLLLLLLGRSTCSCACDGVRVVGVDFNMVSRSLSG